MKEVRVSRYLGVPNSDNMHSVRTYDMCLSLIPASSLSLVVSSWFFLCVQHITLDTVC